jgi:hypothetical protein
MHETSSLIVTAPAERVLTTHIGTGMALLDLASNEYFSIDEVGSFIWEQLRRPITIEAIIAAVAERYEIAPEACADDVRTLVKELRDANLLQPVAPEPAH